MNRPLPAGVRALAHAECQWWDIDGSDPAALRWLESHMELHPLAAEDIHSRRRQRAKLDRYESHLFLVMHVPRQDPVSGRIVAAELNVILTEHDLITVCKDPIDAVSELMSRAAASPHVRGEVMSDGPPRLLYEVLDRALDECFPLIDRIGEDLDLLEEEIFTGSGDAVVRDISDLKQQVISIRKLIGPERPVLRQLERAMRSEQLDPYFDELTDQAARIWDALENYKEVAEALEATAESITGHRLNAMLAVLTVLSAILLPLTLITGIYGMNIDALPFAHHGAWSLVFLLALMIAIAGGVIGYFRWRRWL